MPLRRLVPWLALAGLSTVLATGCGSDDGTTGSAGSPSTTGAPAADQVGVPPGPSTTAVAADTSPAPRTNATPAPSTTSGAAAIAPSTVASPRERVVVDLAMPAQPQSAVEAAQDQVIAALGDHGTLLRRLTATAQMSVSVDVQGRRILAAHPLVARVHVDTADSSATN
jgi:hypothetical protein